MARKFAMGDVVTISGNTYPLKDKFRKAGLTWDGSAWRGELTGTLAFNLPSWIGTYGLSVIDAEQEKTAEAELNDIYRDWSDNPDSEW